MICSMRQCANAFLSCNGDISLSCEVHSVLTDCTKIYSMIISAHDNDVVLRIIDS